MVNREYRVYDTKGEEEDNWMAFYRFALSYKKAFKTLINNEVNQASLGRNYDEEDILSILLNFFQFVELSLKSLLSKKGKLIKTHDLELLIRHVEKEYPDFNLSKNSKSFLYGADISDRTIRTLDYMRLKYPTDSKGDRYWLTENKLGSFLMLDGIYNITSIIIKEFEDYFKKIL